MPRSPYTSYTSREEPGQTVYIFGAGATRAEGEEIPVNANLLEKSYSDGNPVNGSLKQTVKIFLKELLHEDSFARRVPTFEELFTYVDLALTKNK